jgi:enoyl-CoA hydratase/carnithine racemase
MVETFFLDRPQAANALDLKTAQALASEIKKAVKNKSPGFIIASQNLKVFCAGGDLKEYSKMKTKNEGVKVNRAIRKILQDFQKTPLTVVAAVEGFCIGGGCELALATDHIICGQNALFAFKQVTLGLSPGWGGVQRLLSRVRAPIAYDWLSSGRWISAQEALGQGLVDEVVPMGQSLTRAETFISERASISLELILKLKRLVEDPQGEEKLFESLWFSPQHRQSFRS